MPNIRYEQTEKKNFPWIGRQYLIQSRLECEFGEQQIAHLRRYA